MTTPDLPLRQLAVLRYLNDKGPSRVKDITAALRQGRADVQNALRLLAGKGLAHVQYTFPATWAITADGQLVVAYASKADGGES